MKLYKGVFIYIANTLPVTHFEHEDILTTTTHLTPSNIIDIKSLDSICLKIIFILLKVLVF